VNFLRTADESLIALFDIKRIYSLDREGGGCVITAVMRADDALVELARDYTLASLARALDPVRASR
jgi:hypothetical protein